MIPFTCEMSRKAKLIEKERRKADHLLGQEKGAETDCSEHKRIL